MDPNEPLAMQPAPALIVAPVPAAAEEEEEEEEKKSSVESE